MGWIFVLRDTVCFEGGIHLLVKAEQDLQCNMVQAVSVFHDPCCSISFPRYFKKSMKGSIHTNTHNNDVIIHGMIMDLCSCCAHR